MRFEQALDSAEPPVNRPPTGLDGIEEKLEIVEPLPAQGRDLSLHLFDGANELLQKRTQLFYAASHRLDLEA